MNPESLDSILLSGALLAAVIVVGITCILIVRHLGCKRCLSRELRRQGAVHRDLDRRSRIVLSHATDYSNSLGKDGVRLVNELRTGLAAVRRSLDTAASLLAEGSAESVAEAEGYFGEEGCEAELEASGHSRRCVPIRSTWADELEDKLQRLGQAVASASTYREQAGISSPNRSVQRGPTLLNMLRARIRP